MRLHDSWLLVNWRLLLRFSKLLDQCHWLALEASLEPSASARMEQFGELVGWQVKQCIELNTTVGLSRMLKILLLIVQT